MTFGEFKKWLALCGFVRACPQIIAQSGVAASVTGVTAETVLATIQLPALSKQAQLRITHLFSMTNNANSKVLTARLGGVTIGGYSAASVASSVMQRCGMNRGATNSQIWTPAALSGSFGTSANAFTLTNVDTSVPTTLTITGTLANAADTLTLEGYQVELLAP